MAQVLLKNLIKQYDDIVAVDSVNLEVKDKEFVVLVGPSGCGKSTTLRLVAGLDDPTEGEIYIDNKLVNDVAPKDRNIAMVFQNFALYPHKNVYENMAFGLRLRRVPKQRIDEEVRRTAQILGIEELLERKPKQLSGGQKQRVALGRAIVRNPAVFLFDEPLCNLDAKLRVEMRAELSKLHRRLEATVIYVTHDQVEAMTMGDRIVVMNGGRVQQVGTPMEVYDHPVNIMVAGFIGSPGMNFLRGKLIRLDSCLCVDLNGLRLKLATDGPAKYDKSVEREVIIGIRPEDIVDTSPMEHDGEFSDKFIAQVEVFEPLGAEVILELSLRGLPLKARVSPQTKAKEQQDIQIQFNLSKIHIFDADTERLL